MSVSQSLFFYQISYGLQLSPIAASGLIKRALNVMTTLIVINSLIICLYLKAFNGNCCNHTRVNLLGWISSSVGLAIDIDHRLLSASIHSS